MTANLRRRGKNLIGHLIFAGIAYRIPVPLCRDPVAGHPFCMLGDVPSPRSAAVAHLLHQSLNGGYRSIVCQPDCFSTTGALDRSPQAQCSVADNKLPPTAWAASRSTDMVASVKVV